jgi:bacterioferritin-associated ferredoxin
MTDIKVGLLSTQFKATVNFSELPMFVESGGCCGCCGCAIHHLYEVQTARRIVLLANKKVSREAKS